MTEEKNNLDKELHEYGTSTDSIAPSGTTSADGEEAVENPLGFNADSDRAEETSIESTDEGGRSSVEDL